MKENRDVAKGWIRKTENDIDNIKTMIENRKSFDTACFHAQQAGYLCMNCKSIYF